jgi:hypothetical protein
MCTVNWGLLAQWAQFAAILFTGCAAVYVANRQLGVYNAALKESVKTEKFRNSIKVLEGLRAPSQMFGVTASPMDAVVDIQRAIKAGEAPRYLAISELLRQSGKHVGSKAEYDWYLALNAKTVIIVDYYMSMIELGREGVLQNDYVARKVSAFYPVAYESLIALTGDQFKGGDLENFYNEMVAYRNKRLASQKRQPAGIEASDESGDQK